MCDLVFSFKDDNHQRKSFSRALEFRLQKNLCDVEIDVHGQKFYYHSLILASCSEFFSNILTIDQKNATMKKVTVNESDIEVVQNVIEYCYTGSIDMPKEKILKIFSLASLFILEPLIHECCKILIRNIDVDNCLDILEMSKLHSCTELEIMILDFIGVHLEKIMYTTNFINMNFNNLKNIISSDNLIVSSEIDIFKGVEKWIQHNTKERNQYKASLLQQVRLTSMPLQFIFDEVQPYCGLESACQVFILDAIQYISMPNRRNQIKSINTKPRMPNYTMMIAGGWNAGTYDSIPFVATSTIEIYNVKAKKWQKYIDTGINKRACGIGLIGDEILFIGGLDNEVTKNVDSINLLTGEKKSLPPLQLPRSFPLTVEYQNCIYCFGGAPSETVSTIEKYDPSTKQWSFVKTDTNIHLGHGSNGVIVGDEFFVMGGGIVKATSLVYAFCFTTKKWRSCSPLKVPRVLPGVNVIDGFIYAIGGNSSFDPRDKILSSVEKYDLSSNTWTMVSDINSLRYSVAAGVMGRNLIAIGGADGAIALKTVQSYNPKTNTWQDFPPLYQPREHMRVFKVPIKYLDNKFVQ